MLYKTKDSRSQNSQSQFQQRFLIDLIRACVLYGTYFVIIIFFNKNPEEPFGEYDFIHAYKVWQRR